MASELITNSLVSFICARNFTYAGEEYTIGEDFPQENATNIQTLVRTRYVIPVVDDLNDAPRHWFRDVRVRSDVLAKLGVSGEHLLNKAAPEWNVSDHIADDVIEYVNQHPELLLDVLNAEKNSEKPRTTLIAKLEKMLPDPEEETEDEKSEATEENQEQPETEGQTEETQPEEETAKSEPEEKNDGAPQD